MGCEQSTPALGDRIALAHKQHVPVPEAQIRGALLEMLKRDDLDLAPQVVRLAFHDAGTFKDSDGIGGSNASFRFLKGQEANGVPSGGMHSCITYLSAVAHRFEDSVSVADVWALAGCVAVEAMGGPHIPWSPGRIDSKYEDGDDDSRLPSPAAKCPVLRAVFKEYNGMSARDLVALSGGHTVGFMHHLGGKWTSKPLQFDNEYFVNLVKHQWVQHENGLTWYIKGQKPKQIPDPSKLTMLTSDVTLVQDDSETKAIVEEFAKDQAAFFSAYTDAYHKVLHLRK